MATVEYSCLDGSPFPVRFADPSDAGRRWVVDREHAATAMTPLAETVRRAGQAGSELAYAESNLAIPSTVRRPPPQANGFEYIVDEPLPPAELDEFAAALRRLSQQHGGTHGVWLHHSLPHVREACAWLEHAAPDTPFGALADRRSYVWSHTAIAGSVARGDVRAVAASCEPVFGDGATLVAYELGQGYANDTTAADLDLWNIARVAAGSDDEKEALHRFLSTYGSRSLAWPIDQPTAAERPDLVDAQIGLLRLDLARDIARVQPRAAARREALAAEIMARLSSDAYRARLARRLVDLEAFVPIREARARWQLMASGAMRGAVQRRGRMLVERAVIERVDDVFFLTPEEYDEPPADLRAVVAARRANHARWAGVTPPTVIGNTERVPMAATRGDGVLGGQPGAPGVATGPARVVLGLDHADSLQPGDVLVTTMTSPPWTPLFAIIGAVVTDAGDALSHVAIAAREYGVPCVVGTNVATVVLHDGDSVTVDGAAGTVTRVR